ncbi:Senescence marker protein-30 (SMP-30) [Oceaniovalibus guishaninsula JLT2003]|uniref:Senescence marker protein-30 (SMP-30) n=1 Tax=Oceaniovalibus guishaninsula JLT2003 TaxID=1231392 RepID=K2HM53_9RHOB|nr:SMP-30/gluconolactonase/LRE family protein [Oceaniovalibus guishaninsula]EKE43964.1 Senescence marker protein-30 (SMP-30) [Oceaniovalibus guishaninsula JLT2003]
MTDRRIDTHDATRCLLGEGSLWHPERRQLFWCDILSNRVLSRVEGSLREWAFDSHVSTCGWIDRDRLLVATRTDLTILNVETDLRERLCPLEDDRPANRSNDGRADPWGGFWIGTMGHAKETGAGTLYRWYRGELRKLKAGMTINNSTCFSPDGGHAYFSDTPTQMIMRWDLDGDGWPKGDPVVWADLRNADGGDGYNPDGAVCDAEGRVWNAQWGASRIACYGPDGAFLDAIPMPARQVTCPAFGGPDLTTLFCTSAAAGLSEGELSERMGNGRTFAIEGVAKGQAEHRVVL